MSWQASSFLLLALALAAGFGWYERDRPPARVLALVAALAALAVVGRLAFTAVPNVKPTTDIVLFAGYALGAVPGFAVGAVTAIVSNIFLSQGPWTIWQMAGWGAVGAGGALLARALRGREPNRLLLAAVCGLAGLAFGAWMDVYQWTLGARQDLDSYLVVAGTSLPYNLAHAIGNVVFCLLIGPAFIRALTRYRRRLEVRWERAPARAATTTLLALAFLAALPALAGAATPSERAERYLLRAQNTDGGFGAAPGQSSSPLYSGWTGLGLAAAARNPRDVSKRGGRSLAAYVTGGVRGMRDIGEIERTVLVLRAAGLDPRSVAGRDLVAEIEARRRSDGSISGFVSYTAFGVLALRAAGEPAGKPTVRWLLGSQNADGGFGVARSSASDSDMTGAALQALAVVGRSGSPAARRAVAYLREDQGSDGGFGQMAGRSSNAQSTAYAVQGLLAVRASAAPVSRALAYLTRQQRRDGSIAYSSTSSQTPVWVTAQALAALRREPLPIAAVPRAPRKPRRPAKEAEATAAPADRSDTATQKADGRDSRAADRSESSRATAQGDSSRAAVDSASQSAEHPAPAEAEPVGAGPATSPARVENDEDGGGGASTWLVIAAVAVTLALLLLLRRRVRRSRLAAP
ncbi:MAG: prenyltransferase/squalene oxidase repeat-containing protein [Thermoleophilaceae bacterium]